VVDLVHLGTLPCQLQRFFGLPIVCITNYWQEFFRPGTWHKSGLVWSNLWWVGRISYFRGGGLSYITPFVYISVIFPCLKIRLYHYFIYSGSIAAYYFSVHIDSFIYSGSIAVYYYYRLFIPARPPCVIIYYIVYLVRLERRIFNIISLYFTARSPSISFIRSNHPHISPKTRIYYFGI